MLKKNIRKKSLINILRPFIQGFFLFFFIFLFTKVSFPLTLSFVDNIFYNVDPLIFLLMVITGTFIGTAALLSALTVILTVLFGRFFCGHICPAGTIFDISGKLFKNRTLSKPFGAGKYKNIKFYLLVFMLAGSFLGFTALLLFDPLVFLFRVFTLNIFPVVVLTSNFFLDIIRPFAAKAGNIELSMLSLHQPVYHLALFNMIIFAAVIGLIVYEKRFWCRNLCPLGALLAVLSKYSLRTRKVSDECISCSKCAKTCPMNSIKDNFKDTSFMECILCERCASVCPVNAISFEFSIPQDNTEHNPSRRGLIITGALGFLTALTASTAVAVKTRAANLLRPPGSLIEKDFLDSCLRCGECMKICPTKGIQPAVFQSGFEGFMTPVLIPRIGGCEQQCNQCGMICPTGAIRKLSLEEKNYAVIGNATIEKNLCIAWEQGKICLICDEVCPYDAVEFRPVTDEFGTIKRPYVIEDKCTGCGLCEKACPVLGQAAIYVNPNNETRKNGGSYITDKVRELRKVKDDRQDFSIEQGKAYSDSSFSKTRTQEPDSLLKSGNQKPSLVNPDDEMPAGFVK